MRKLLSLVLISVLLLAQNYSLVFAQGEDITPPQFISGSVDKQTINPGEILNVTMEFEDNESGTTGIYVQWTNKGDPNSSLDLTCRETRNKGTYELTIPSNAKPGIYEAVYISVHDNVQNFNFISKNTENAELFAKLDFTVPDVGQDLEAPVVTKVTRLTDKVTAPGFVHFQIEVSDDQSGIWDVSINFLDLFGVHHSIGSNKIKDGVYDACVYIESKYQKLIFNGVTTRDGVNNYKDYSAKDLGITSNEFDIIPQNYEEDKNAPKLVSISYDKKELLTPDYIDINLTIEDESEDEFVPSQGVRGKVYFKSDNEVFDKVESISAKTDVEGREIKNQYQARLDFNYSEKFSGEIYVDKIELCDAANNSVTYSVEDGTLKKEYFEVSRPEDKYTLVINSEVDGYIDKISQLPDGSKVLCNVTRGKAMIEKELFDAVKDRDITITFMSIYDSDSNQIHGHDLSSSNSTTGIQWIINGKDIIHPTKDIDLTMKFSSQSYSKYVLDGYDMNDEALEEFWSNINSDEDYIAKKPELEAWVEESLHNYFNQLIADGYEIPQHIYENPLRKDENESEIIMNVDGLEAILYQILPQVDPDFTEYISMEFADNGLLPCKTTIRMKPSYALRAMFGAQGMSLYYNHNGNYEFLEDNINIGTDGYCEFVIEHNSEYCLSESAFETLVKTEVVKPSDNDNKTDVPETPNNENTTPNRENDSNKAPQTGDVSVIYLWAILVLTIIVVGFVCNKCTRRYYK